MLCVALLRLARLDLREVDLARLLGQTSLSGAAKRDWLFERLDVKGLLNVVPSLPWLIEGGSREVHDFLGSASDFYCHVSSASSSRMLREYTYLGLWRDSWDFE